MTQSPLLFSSRPGIAGRRHGKELAEKYPIARQTFEEADEALGYKLSQLCFEGPKKNSG